MDIIRIIIALFFPPLAAFLTVGIGLHFWLNLVMWLLFGTVTILFLIPLAIIPVIHAIWLVVKKNS